MHFFSGYMLCPNENYIHMLWDKDNLYLFYKVPDILMLNKQKVMYAEKICFVYLFSEYSPALKHWNFFLLGECLKKR